MERARGPVKQLALSLVTVGIYAAFSGIVAGAEKQRGSAGERRKPVRQTIPETISAGQAIYKLFDNIAGGIECTLRLQPPHQRCGQCDAGGGCNFAPCDSAACDSIGCNTHFEGIRGQKAGEWVRPVAPNHAGIDEETLPPVPVPIPTKKIQAERSMARPVQDQVPPSMLKTMPRLPSNPLPRPERVPEAKPLQDPRVPAPTVPDQLKDPFEDDPNWIPGKNESIRRSAYYE